MTPEERLIVDGSRSSFLDEIMGNPSQKSIDKYERALRMVSVNNLKR